MRLACTLVVSAIVASGCGGDGDPPTTTRKAATPPPPAKPKPARVQITENANKWAAAFGAAQENACAYMTGAAKQSTCSQGIYRVFSTTGKPGIYQRKLQNTKVAQVKIRGHAAGVRFDNGTLIEMRKVGEKWAVENMGGDAGTQFFN